MTPALFALVAVAVAPWCLLAFAFSRGLPLLSALLDHARAQSRVGGEPATMAERRLRMEEEDRAFQRSLQLKAAEDERMRLAAEHQAFLEYARQPEPPSRTDAERFKTPRFDFIDPAASVIPPDQQS